ncbi:MAG: hypothetical protein B6243_02430 [Anaerolineaceae bacterium 4572_5.2]|nr:MAG: hypothetical protein B6243_02430 [Anaerolineaceae bacterium 4572_5.2]
MKILMPNHFPLQGSGSGIYTMNVATELVEAGHEVMVIVPDHQPVDGYPFPVKTIIFSNGKNNNPQLDFNFPCFTTHPQSATTFYELSDEQLQAYLNAWEQAFTEAIEKFKPDVIHAHHVWVTPYVARKTGLPYIISCHGTDLMGFKEAQDQVARVYNAADVSVAPSRIEPFGLVAVEALACGTPVVATNAGGLPDFINEEVGALVPMEDPESLASAIIYEIKNGTKQTKGVYANQYAFENFTWSQQVARMVKLYKDAIKK